MKYTGGRLLHGEAIACVIYVHGSLFEFFGDAFTKKGVMPIKSNFVIFTTADFRQGRTILAVYIRCLPLSVLSKMPLQAGESAKTG